MGTTHPMEVLEEEGGTYMPVDVCFIDPYTGDSYMPVVSSENLGVGYISAILEENGYSADLICCDLYNTRPQEATQQLLSREPGMIGFSLYTFRSLEAALEIVRSLRREGYDKHIVFGGRYLTIRYREILSDNSHLIDSVCIGEGEITMLELTNCLLRNAGDWRKVNGIAFAENGKLQINPARELIVNLNSLPYPKRFHAEEIVKRGIPLSVLHTRGCYYGQCHFCSVSSLYKHSVGPIYRKRSVGSLIDEMVFLSGRYNHNDFMILADSFIEPGERGQLQLREFMRRIDESGRSFTFGIACQAKDVRLDTFRELRKRGLTSVYVGWESGSDNVLRYYRKRSSVDDNRKSAEVVRALRLNAPEGVSVGFIFYSPNANLEDIKQNLDFLEKYGTDCDIYGFFSHCRPLDGAPMERELRDSGRLTEFDRKGYYIRHPDVQLLDYLVHPVREMVTRDLDHVLYYQFRFARAYARTLPEEQGKTYFQRSQIIFLEACSQLRRVIIDWYRAAIQAIEDDDLSPCSQLMDRFRDSHISIMRQYAGRSMELARDMSLSLPSQVEDVFPAPPVEWNFYLRGGGDYAKEMREISYEAIIV